MTAVSGRWWGLTPRDTVLVRDGRSFDAGPAEGSGNEAIGVPPWPSTVAGAMTTAFAEREPDAVRGPVLGKRDGPGTWSPYFPVPADVVTTEGATRRSRGRIPAWRLRPAHLDARGPGGAEHGWEVTTDLADGPALPMLAPAGCETAEPVEGLFPSELMSAYLADALDASTNLRNAGLLLQPPLIPERRVGLALDHRTARKGYLYSTTHLRPKEEGKEQWGFLVECLDGEGTSGVTPLGPVPLGGKARIADVEATKGDLRWPDAPPTYPGGRVLLYVATPAVWPDGWRPPLPPDARLVGACVPAPVPVATSSARLARQPKPGENQPRGLLATTSLRWAVPAGAVYLLEFDGAPSGRDPASRAAEWAVGEHGRALGPSADCDATTDVDRTKTAGFGVVLTGRWSGQREGGTGG